MKKQSGKMGNQNAAKADGHKPVVVQIPATPWQSAGYTKAAQLAGKKRPEWARLVLDAAARKAGVEI